MTAEVVRCSPRDIPRPCRDRFNRLIRADKPVPVEAKPRPVSADDIRDGQGSGSPTFASRDLAEPRLEDDLVPECPPPETDEAAQSPGYEPSILADEEAPPIEGMIAASQSHEVWGGLSRIRRLSN